MFFFLGYGNLNDSDFTVQQLLPPIPSRFADGLFIFHVDTDARCADMDVVGQTALESELLGCHVDLWQLDLDCQDAIQEFVPLAAARPMDPAITAQVWPPPPTRTATSVSERLRPVRPLSVLLGRDLAAPAVHEAPVQDDQQLASEEQEDDNRAILDETADEVYDAAAIPCGWAPNSWSRSDSEEEDGAGGAGVAAAGGGGLAGERPRRSAFDCLVHGPRVGAPPPPPPGRPVTDGLCGRRSFASTPRARICASRKHLARLIGIAEQSVENMVLLLCAPSPSLAGTTGPSAVYGHG